MMTVAQIQDAIRALPPDNFMEFFDWMNRRYDEVIEEGGYESPELEAAMLAALDSPSYPLDDALLDSIRKGRPSNKAAKSS
ncbi:hypothetical protein [Prosthecobacter sp.]|uniref:hypothetical protein n=1 Tax=Prosthecobacter sp. TaxID=1965333 RepID=UPI003785277A